MTTNTVNNDAVNHNAVNHNKVNQNAIDQNTRNQNAIDQNTTDQKTKKRGTISRLLVTQIGAVLVLFVFIGFLLFDNVPDNVTLSSIEEALEQTDVFPGNMQPADSIRIRRLYGINVNDYPEVLSYIPESSMDVDELLIVHVSDESQLSDVKAAMESRLSSQKTSFDGYGTDQTQLLNEADIKTRGNYIWFAAGKDHADWNKIIQEVLH